MFPLHPLLILAIGMATVLGMIIVLKLNAFLSLITAAIVVSLLAPGVPLPEKISEVAKAFGNSAAGIGIVIALAAIIGKCMMDSGAADRVVRAFLKMLGEERAPTALMGSGFVLAVPVFFDTVFYLLVPLARSLFQRTQRNYLKYILAIAAGGAITHTLVPPTPGPLFMAANLNIDVGVMILVGGLVAAVAAVVGLIMSSYMDHRMPIPMRPIGNEPEPKPLDDDQLPPLWLSVLPVVLPVLLISTNTVLGTLADREHATRFRPGDVKDGFVRVLANEDGSQPSPARRVRELLSKEMQESIEAADDNDDSSITEDLIRELNTRILPQRQFYEAGEEDFDKVVLHSARIDKLDADEAVRKDRRTINALLGKDRSRLKRVEVERLNRLLLEASFPDDIQRHEWNTSLRNASAWSSLFGNANLALLLSAAVAMWTLYRQRKPTLTELAKVVEVSLMSGGVIILITAAGGAFGAMLKAANIGAEIQSLFGGNAQGTMMLFIGFGVAALLKVAQGSSTVAMITGSSMLAAMITSPESLGYHPVYLATAIGAGSLVGSWMNDSGFWIFAKMGGLTEVEALKSWTILLVVLGVVSMIMTLVLSTVLPLA